MLTCQWDNEFSKQFDYSAPIFTIGGINMESKKVTLVCHSDKEQDKEISFKTFYDDFMMTIRLSDSKKFSENIVDNIDFESEIRH